MAFPVTTTAPQTTVAIASIAAGAVVLATLGGLAGGKPANTSGRVVPVSSAMAICPLNEAFGTSTSTSARESRISVAIPPAPASGTAATPPSPSPSTDAATAATPQPATV